MRENIISYYKELHGSPTFLVEFEKKVQITIRTRAADGTVDSRKMRREMKLIAEQAKERNLGGRIYLSKIIKFALTAVRGIHGTMEFDEESLELIGNKKKKLDKRFAAELVNEVPKDDTKV